MDALIKGREVLLLDGAMGTQLIARGLKQGDWSIAWNLDRAEDVLAVHKSYVEAGSDCLTTNTFCGSPIMMARSGHAHRFEELNRGSVAIAKEASAGRCMVLGNIGPCGDFLAPLGDLETSDLTRAVKNQARILVESGVDGFIVETMSDTNEMETTVQALREFGLPIIASFTFEKGAIGLQTALGTEPAQAIATAIDAGASIVGANCGTSLSLQDYQVLGGAILDAAPKTPVILQPNAGSPRLRGDQFEYDLTPEDFATWAQAVVARGVSVIGGCCGTSPAHIRAVSRALRS